MQDYDYGDFWEMEVSEPKAIYICNFDRYYQTALYNIMNYFITTQMVHNSICFFKVLSIQCIIKL